MGYSTRSGNIRTYWPDDTEDTMYHSETTSLNLIIKKAQEKWPGITLDEIDISSDRMHTDCIGYDLYDPTDYTDFTIIKANSSYMERVTAPNTEVINP